MRVSSRLRLPDSIIGALEYWITRSSLRLRRLTSQTVRGALAWKFQIWSSAAENPRTFQSRDWLTNG